MLAVIAGVLFAAWTLISKAVVADVGGMWLGFSNLAIAGLVLAPWALLAEWGEPQASWSWLLVLGLGMTALLGPLYLVVLDRPAGLDGERPALLGAGVGAAAGLGDPR